LRIAPALEGLGRLHVAAAAIDRLLAVIGPLRAAIVSLALVAAVVAGVAADRMDDGMAGRAHSEIAGRRGEAGARAAVATAALNRARGDVRRRRHARSGHAVVTRDAVRVGGGVRVRAARPAHVAAGLCCSVARQAVRAIGRHVTCVGGRAVGALRTLARVAAVMTGVAAQGARRRMVHRIGREGRRRAGVAVRALERPGRDVRRRRLTRRRHAIVAVAAVRVRSLVRVLGARPGDIAAAGGGRVAIGAVVAARRQMAGVGRHAKRALRAFAGVCAIVAGVAAHRRCSRMVHRVGDEARRGTAVAIRALHCT